MIQIIVNIFGLIEEILKLKLNVIGMLFLISFDLIEKIIKSCKATNLEFLKLKEKLGLCLYGAICDERELISTSEEIFKEEKNLTWHDVENEN